MGRFLKVLIVSVLVSVFFLETTYSTKYTSKELEDLRKFYYDDLDYLTNPDENGSKSRHSSGESRSSSKPPKKKTSKKEGGDTDPTNTNEDADRAHGPGDFFSDARKFLDAGRKTLQHGAESAQRTFPSIPLPRIRSIRSEFNFELTKEKRDTTQPESKALNEDVIENNEDKEVHHASEDDSYQRGSARAGHKGPLRRFQDDAAETAADTGGKILSILNKLTPPPHLNLPTPLPNLEDFGG